MATLVNLPSPLFASIAVYYLDAIDLVKFDSACCSTQLRSTFLQELMQQVPTSQFPLVQNGRIPCVAQYNWIGIRKIPIRTLRIDQFSLCDNLMLIDFTRISVLYINAVHGSGASFAKLVNACVNLSTLACINYDFILLVDPSILQRLEFLSIVDRVSINLSSLRHIESSCTNLVKIAFLLSKSARCRLLFDRNPRLCSIIGSFAYEDLQYAVDCCPLIDYTAIETEIIFNLSLITQKIQKSPGANITLDCKKYCVKYENTNSKRDLIIRDYQNEDNDLEAFVAATRNLTSFVVTADLTDSMVMSVVNNSFEHLKSFLCEVFLVSVTVLRRVLIECKLLENVQFSCVSEDMKLVFNDLPDIPLSTIMIGGDSLTLSTVATVLTNCHHLNRFEFAVVTNLDLEVSAIQDQIVEYCSKKASSVLAKLIYHQDGFLKQVKYDGLSFEYTERQFT